MWITHGPIMKLIISAAIAAVAALNVMYSNKLKIEYYYFHKKLNIK